MQTTLTLADLTARTGLEVLGRLEREVTIPVTDALQAQGDLLVIPIALLAAATPGRAGRDVSIADSARWHEVPGAGIEVLRAGTGGTTGVAYLIHPEHGGSGIAPGTYVIRRQRERGGATRRSSYFPHAADSVQYVLD
jgi:hypothetical protein